MTKASKFKLEISLDNDAFKPEACIEIENILHEILTELERWGDIALAHHHIKDRNGNRVGFWTAE